ncbi:hypothetical protein [Nocardioides ultimimeridianus]
MDQDYGIRDLALAHVDAARFADKHPDLASFHTGRLRALSAAFAAGAAGKLDPFDRDCLEGLAESTVTTLVGLHSPFASYLEAPSCIIDLYVVHARPINESLDGARRSLEDLLAGVLASLHGLPGDRTVTADELRTQGFDPAEPWPDELDYL